MSDKDRGRMNKMDTRAERVVGVDLESVDSVYQSLLGRKLDHV